MDDALTRKVDAVIADLIAETARINARAGWYPMLLGAGICAAAIGFAKYLG